MIRAVGGPLDGMDVPMRALDGLLLVNKPERSALVYRVHGDRLIAEEIAELDPQRAVAAAESKEYDVLAYDKERMGSWRR